MAAFLSPLVLSSNFTPGFKLQPTTSILTSPHRPTCRWTAVIADGDVVAGKKKAVIVGGGWAGLGAALHLTGLDRYDVTLVEAGKKVGGLVAGYEEDGKPIEVGIHGYWRPYNNLFRLCDDLGLKPFTDWTRSDSFSPLGKETSAPIFGDLPRLPTPLGTLVYTQFHRVSVQDRLTALPLLLTLADFDPKNKADWERYDKMSARELLRTMGVSPELYRLIESMLLVGTFCPGEQTSAAACLAFLYFFILSGQDAFDVVWPRGTSGELIFGPIVDEIEERDGLIKTGKRVKDYETDSESGRITGVILEDNEVIPADVVISCVGISGMQGMLRSSKTLASYPEFRAVTKLGAIDVLAVRLYLDRSVKIDKPSNAAFGFDDTTGWTLFDLTRLHDRYKDTKTSVIECDFYGSQQFTPMDDETVVETVRSYIGQIYPEFNSAQVTDSTVLRVPRGVTHFSPGSHQHMLTCESPIENLFNAGDWIWTDHGSFSQERALVTGLQAANKSVDFLEGGAAPESLHATILPVPEDENHIKVARDAAKRVRAVRDSILPDFAWL